MIPWLPKVIENSYLFASKTGIIRELSDESGAEITDTTGY
jgi:hypothetical protein